MNLSTLSTEKLLQLRSSLSNSGPQIYDSSPFNTVLDSLAARRLADELRGRSEADVRWMLDVLIADRKARHRGVPTVVYTGPEQLKESTRMTRYAFSDLFSSAASSVWIAGYTFDHSSDILEPLQQRMQQCPELEAHVLIDIGQEKDSLTGRPVQFSENQARDRARIVTERIWDFHGGRRPNFYFDARHIEPKSWFSMHAKCSVVDSRHSVVGSANFTNRAQTRNLELGVLIRDDEAFARTLQDQLEALVDSGAFLQVR